VLFKGQNSSLSLLEMDFNWAIREVGMKKVEEKILQELFFGI